MDIYAWRAAPTDDGTFSDVSLGSSMSLKLKLAELPWKNNLPNVSCIPEGDWDLLCLFSPKHQKNLWHVMGVPGRNAIELHSANFAGDVSKGKISQVLGCGALGMTVEKFLAGTTYSKDAPPLPADQMGVTSSEAALALFMDALKISPMHRLHTRWVDYP